MEGGVTMPRKKQHEEIRRKLTKRKEELLELISEHLAEAGGAGEVSAVDLADLADKTLEGDLRRTLLETEVEELRNIEDALTKMEEGTYGVCKECGKPIPEGRLKALPFASRCLLCQREVEEQMPPRHLPYLRSGTMSKLEESGLLVLDEDEDTG